jgi:hypothetical protein
VRKTSIFAVVLAVCSSLAVPALAVSDGNYSPARQGCSGRADDSETPRRTERHCHNAVVTVFDESGHTYLRAGTLQTAEGEAVHALDVCVDPGRGTRYCALVDRDGVHDLRTSKGTPADPGTGVHVYFGADDNLDEGEHDSSPQVSNGPSDGGAVVLNVAPKSLQAWTDHLRQGDRPYLLTHPIPLVDTGAGGCADGLCISIQSRRRMAFRGGDDSRHRDAADYEGKRWDPVSCAGPTDSRDDCGGHRLSYWEDEEGTVYVEPGLQIYEDPDAQGSPEGPYPIPAVYVGTCGVVLGGGVLQAPDSPVTNGAGQVVIPTGC